MAAVPVGFSTTSSTHQTRNVRVWRLGAVLKEAVLAVVGVLGLLAIAWLACSAVFGLSIVVFKTGSMAPAMPTGSAAIVRDIEASDIVVGDVVTVQRDPAALPVTHRVVAVSTDSGNADARVLTLKGDANATADIKPYTVSEAKVVLVSVPSAGYALRLVQSPLYLATITVLVALICVWAFWPRAEHRHRRDSRVLS